MADSKKKTGGSTGRSGRSAGSSGSKKENNEKSSTSERQAKIKEMQKKRQSDSKLRDEVWGVAIAAIGIFLVFATQLKSVGQFGEAIHNILNGLFGSMSLILPYFLLAMAVCLFFQKMQHINGRTAFFTILIYIMLCTLNAYRFISANSPRFGFGDILLYYKDGVDGKMAGAVGMEIGSILVNFFGKPGLIIFSIALIAISALLVVNTPISRQISILMDRREEKQILREMERAEAARGGNPAHSAGKTGTPAQTASDTSGSPDPVQRVSSTDTKKKKKHSFFGLGRDSDDDAIELPRADQAGEQSLRIIGGAMPEGNGIHSPLSESIEEPFAVPEIHRTRKASQQSSRPRGNGKKLEVDEENRKKFVEVLSAEDGFDSGASTTEKGYGLDGGEAGSGKKTGFGLDGYERKKSRVSGYREPGTYKHGRDADSSHGNSSGSSNSAADSSSSGRKISSGKGSGLGLDGGTGNSAASAARKAASAAAGAAGAGAAAAAVNNKAANTPTAEDHAEIAREVAAGSVKRESAYTLPPVSLLRKPKRNPAMLTSMQLEQRADLLETTLKNFNVDAKVIGVTQGASVTRYEVQPATGVKVSKITGLANDIALNMRAKSIRIEAPIPGKAAIGIEVDNAKSSPVFIRELIESEEFRNAESKISFVVGKDIEGRNVIADLRDMPHLLIAGATGSGKSVCINSIITSILYKSTPDEVKMVLIDPKVVELGNYNGIPHMLIPVVTDPKKAAAALNWAVNEMTQRYKKFAEAGVKELESFNEYVKANLEEEKSLPQVVIIIDELAELMMSAPSQVEESICRLAQMGRAAGMHLIVATQRPSVDIVTGVIKANIPSRIAFSVSSQVDSKTILDMGGAEKLLGKGDMLFSPVGSNKPIRIQGPFISESETAKVIDFVKKQAESDYNEDIIKKIETPQEEGRSDTVSDELTEDAIAFILKQKQASVSMLQRRFRIGYNRAARIIDEIEDRGIIGPSDGSRPRQVLVTAEEYYGGGDGAEGTESEENN
jgi:S-DNA-T family DNA segregation ATPase FtsK/SpoIIIE